MESFSKQEAENFLKNKYFFHVDDEIRENYNFIGVIVASFGGQWNDFSIEHHIGDLQALQTLFNQEELELMCASKIKIPSNEARFLSGFSSKQITEVGPLAYCLEHYVTWENSGLHHSGAITTIEFLVSAGADIHEVHHSGVTLEKVMEDDINLHDCITIYNGLANSKLSKKASIAISSQSENEPSKSAMRLR